jgi:hypothetical protein
MSRTLLAGETESSQPSRRSGNEERQLPQTGGRCSGAESSPEILYAAEIRSATREVNGVRRRTVLWRRTAMGAQGAKNSECACEGSKCEEEEEGELPRP